jgi:D-alanyl-D-alanine carboxypeptidase
MKKLNLICCFCVFLLGLFIISSCKKDEEATIASNDTFQQKVEEILTDKIAEYNVAGVNAYVKNAQGQTCEVGVGMADVENNVAMKGNTKMRIASISKTFLATVVLQLSEENQIGLDQMMGQYLSNDIVSMFPYGDEVSVLQLLNHTSGIYDFEDPGFIALLFEDPLYHWTPLELLQYAVNSDSSVHQVPGTVFSYSNTNYILLGLIVEAVSGISMEKNIRDRVLSPLNLENTFCFNEGIPQENYAVGYHPIDETNVFTVSDQSLPMYFEWAHGQMVSSVGDLYVFFDALSKGELFIKAETQDVMFSYCELSGFTYGCGVCTMGSLGYGHSGATAGFISLATFNPDDNSAIIFCFNDYNEIFMNAVVEAIAGLM